MNNELPPIHPGEILQKDYLQPLSLTVRALARALHVQPSRINNVVLQRASVTPDTALRLARYFGGDAKSWLNMQQAYDLKIAEAKSLEKINQQIQPRNSHGVST